MWEMKMEKWARAQDLIRSQAVILGTLGKPMKGSIVVVEF